MKNRYIIFTAMGIELIGIILSCLYLGKLVDEKYNTKGIALAGLPMIGLVGWIYHIVVLTKEVDQAVAEESGNNEEKKP